MGAKQPIALADEQFASKTEAIKYFQDIQNRACEVGNLPVTVSDEEQNNVIEALLETHEDYEGKIGPGVQHFFVDYTENNSDVDESYIPRHDAVEIRIMRVDGTAMDFSWRNLLRKYHADPEAVHKNLVKEALRAAIEPYRKQVRENAVSEGRVIVDPHGVERITNYSQTKVIYRSPTWPTLTDGFASREGGWRAIELTEEDNTIYHGKRLDSPLVKNRWIGYWIKYAHPLVVAK